MAIMRGLRTYTPSTITSPDRLRRALAITRVTHLAVTRFELEATTCAVAVPVFGTGGDVVAAIELTVPDLGRDLHPVVAPLLIAARSLSRELAGATHDRAGSPSTVSPRVSTETALARTAG
jgi:DNA-binding IclR family transcriptional regulator